MTYTPDFSGLTTPFTDTLAFGQGWIIPMIIALLVMVFITRDVERWKVMFFPIIIMERVVGLDVHYLLIIMGGIQFTVEVISIQTLGGIAGALKKFSTKTKGVGDIVIHREERKLDRILGREKKRKALNIKKEEARELGERGKITFKKARSISQALKESMKKRGQGFSGFDKKKVDNTLFLFGGKDKGKPSRFFGKERTIDATPKKMKKLENLRKFRERERKRKLDAEARYTKGFKRRKGGIIRR